MLAVLAHGSGGYATSNARIDGGMGTEARTSIDVSSVDGTGDRTAIPGGSGALAQPTMIDDITHAPRIPARMPRP